MGKFKSNIVGVFCQPDLNWVPWVTENSAKYLNTLEEYSEIFPQESILYQKVFHMSCLIRKLDILTFERDLKSFLLLNSKTLLNVTRNQMEKSLKSLNHDFKKLFILIFGVRVYNAHKPIVDFINFFANPKYRYYPLISEKTHKDINGNYKHYFNEYKQMYEYFNKNYNKIDFSQLILIMQSLHLLFHDIDKLKTFTRDTIKTHFENIQFYNTTEEGYEEIILHLTNIRVHCKKNFPTLKSFAVNKK